MQQLKELIINELNSAADKMAVINELRGIISTHSPLRTQPVDFVKWVEIERVQANDYNPNSIPSIELKLLYISILQDGYTQPIVTIYSQEIDKYIIVDGFHRYFVCKNNADIRERNNGMLPIVVIDKEINDRMASTVRHNRARGNHSTKGMSSMVFEMMANGWNDIDICNELGMEAEEILKLKHITGFSKLFKDAEYSKSWESKAQIKLRIKHQK